MESAKAAPASSPQIEFLLDLSGSMDTFMRGGSRAALAKGALRSVISLIPPGTNVGVRAFGHREGQEAKEKSCVDSEQILAVAPHATEEFDKAIVRLRPSGLTPLAFALKQIRNDFSAGATGKKVVILLSDGADSCGGDPIAEIASLSRDGYEVEIHAIGIEPNGETKAELEGIAAISGGTVAAIHSPDAIKEALRAALGSAFAPRSSKAGGKLQVFALQFGENDITLAVPFQRYELPCSEGEKFSLRIGGGLREVRVKLRDPSALPLAVLSQSETQSDVVQPLKSGTCVVDISGPKDAAIKVTVVKMVGF